MVKWQMFEEHEHPEQDRAAFDNKLSVGQWRTPHQGEQYKDAEIEPGAPAWWQGEEEASDLFMKSMGVVIPDG